MTFEQLKLKVEDEFVPVEKFDLDLLSLHVVAELQGVAVIHIRFFQVSLFL